MFTPVYLDHNATTPVHARVLEAMLPYLGARCGNPSSRHEYGRAALKAIERAREQVAVAAGAHPTEVVFASGGSEANNLFLKGVAAASGKPGIVAVSAVEHASVRAPARQLVRQGWRILELPVDDAGRVTPDGVTTALGERPSLWSVMLANNETGVLQDVANIASQVREAVPGAYFHTDAVQAFGKIPMDFRALNQAGVHALSVAAHKVHGPKGAAALIADKRLDLFPLIAGGGQERGLRSGTENVAAIVGFGAAVEWAAAERETEAWRLTELRARLETGLRAMGAAIFGAAAARLPNTVCFAFADLDGETLVGRLDRAGFAIASGAACSSASPGPSHVLVAMGVPDRLARGAVRVSLGIENTARHIDDFLLALERTLSELKELTALHIQRSRSLSHEIAHLS
ncbi:MAG: cysteine desulfurase [Zoogloeaceae bacterium]|nr:cysteine desulfurase [Zoogloeaceae bacterium]